MNKYKIATSGGLVEASADFFKVEDNNDLTLYIVGTEDDIPIERIAHGHWSRVSEVVG